MSQLGGGWSDRLGGVYSIDSNGYLQAAAVPNGYAFIGSTAPSDFLVDQQMVVRFTMGSGQFNTPILYARYGETGGIMSKFYGFYGGLGGGKLSFGHAFSGGPTNVKATTNVSLTAGTDYDVRFTCVQTNSTTTTLTLEVFSVTAAGSALCSGTLIVSDSTTDTYAPGLTFPITLQGIAGYPAISWSGGGGGQIKAISTATDIAPVTATALQVVGPQYGAPSATVQNVQVSANGTLASAITVTPSDGGAGGTFSPTSATLAAGSFSQASFSYTPPAGRTTTINLSASGGGLTSPVLPFGMPVTVTVDNNAFLFSPGNWRGDTGRGGSVYRQSWYPGAYTIFQFMASAAPVATLQLPTSTNGAKLKLVVNGIEYDGISAQANVSIPGLIAGAANTVHVHLRHIAGGNRWNNGTSAIKITGMTLDSVSVPGSNVTGKPWALLVGDSITEGFNASTDNLTNTPLSYAALLGRGLRQLGFEYSISACGGNGFLTTGASGNVPAYYMVSAGAYQAASSRWNLVDAGVSLLDSNGQISSYGATNTPPSLITVNFGTNECNMLSSVSDYRAAVAQCLTAWRAAAPNAAIVVLMPFGMRDAEYFPQAYVTALLGGVSDYQAANPWDARVSCIDLGQMFAYQFQTNTTYMNNDHLHPVQAGHALAHSAIAAGVTKALVATAKPYSFA